MQFKAETYCRNFCYVFQSGIECGDGKCPVLDFGQLYNNALMEETLARKIVEIFIDDYNQLYCTIERAAKDMDAIALARHSHRLKGTSLNVGAISLVRFFSILEEAGHSETFDHVPHILEKIKTEFERYKEIASEHNFID